jgi:polysaccharide export outer membrane protein
MWSYEGVDVGDLNNDGHTDIVAANSTSETLGGISVWFGNGKGLWTVDYGTIKGEVFKDVAIADFNNDGFMDLCATSWGVHGGIRVWYGNGRGDWESAPSPEITADFWGIDAADIDGDGNCDIIAGTYLSGLAVWFGDKKKPFKQWQHIQTDGSFWGVLAQDLDLDGKIDITASSFNYEGIVLFYNKGKGKFYKLEPRFTEETNYFGLTSADINHDGYPDLASAHPAEGLHVWIQNIAGITSPALPVESFKMIEESRVLQTDSTKNFSIYFPYAKFNIDSTQVETLTKIIYLLKNYPESHIRLEASCDIRDVTHLVTDGALVKSNVELSDKRANAVKGVLMEAGRMKDDRFQIAAFGALRATAKDTSEYWKDRRVDVMISPRRYVIEKRMKGREEDALMLNESFVKTIADSLAVEPAENKAFTTVEGYAEYRIGSLDLLKISIWEGRTLKTYEVQVQMDGTISFAYNQNLYVQNLTPTQIRQSLLETLKDYYKSPNITIDVLEYNARKASLLGQVRDLQRDNTGPGQYPLEGKMRVVDFISLHGGPTDKADLAQVKVVRANGSTFFLNLYNAMFEGDIQQNIILDDGDIVFVPTLEVSARKFYVLGEVKTPGIYDMKDEVRVLEAIMRAGSFTDRASLSSIVIIRGNITQPEVNIINLEKLIRAGDQSENIEILNGDVIYVPRHFVGSINYFVNQILPSLNTLFLIDRMQ